MDPHNQNHSTTPSSHTSHHPENEPRMLFLRSIHQAKANGTKTFYVPSWFEFFVLDKTKEQLGIALCKAIREVIDLAKKVPCATPQVINFWSQLVSSSSAGNGCACSCAAATAARSGSGSLTTTTMSMSTTPTTTTMMAAMLDLEFNSNPPPAHPAAAAVAVAAASASASPSDHLFDLSSEYICILLSLACKTVIRLRLKVKSSARPENQARFEPKGAVSAGEEFYADVAESPLEYCVRSFIDTIEQGSGIVCLGAPSWRDVAILSGTHVTASRGTNNTGVDTGIAVKSLNSLWATENLLRGKFQDEPDELLAPRTSYAYHLWRFYSTRWRPLESAADANSEKPNDGDYRQVMSFGAMAKIRKRSVRSTWQMIHAACGDLEDLFAWYRAHNGVLVEEPSLGHGSCSQAAGDGGNRTFDLGSCREEEKPERQGDSLARKLQKSEKDKDGKCGDGGLGGTARSTVCGQLSGLKHKASAAGGRLRFGPFKAK